MGKDAIEKSVLLACFFRNFFFNHKVELYSRLKMPGRSRSIADDEENDNNNAGVVRVHAYKRRCPSKSRSKSPRGKKVEKSIAQKSGIEEMRQEVKEPVPQKVCLKEVRKEIKEPLPQKVCLKEMRQEIKEPLPQKVCFKEVQKVREGRKKAAMAYRRLHVDSSSVKASGQFFMGTPPAGFNHSRGCVIE